MQKFKFNYLSHKSLNRWSRTCMAAVIRTQSSSVSLFCHCQGQASISRSKWQLPLRQPHSHCIQSAGRKKGLHISFAFLSYEPELTCMAQLQRTLGSEYFIWVSCPGKKSIPPKKGCILEASVPRFMHLPGAGQALFEDERCDSESPVALPTLLCPVSMTVPPHTAWAGAKQKCCLPP